MAVDQENFQKPVMEKEVNGPLEDSKHSSYHTEHSATHIIYPLAFPWKEGTPKLGGLFPSLFASLFFEKTCQLIL